MRDLWNMTGYVTSDSGAISDIVENHHYVQTYQEAAAVALKDGRTDINSGNVYLTQLLNAVNESLITMDDVDSALYNAFRIRFELGLFDPIDDQPYWHVPPEVVNSAEHQALNLFAAQSSLIMLKNDHQLRYRSIATTARPD